MCRSATVVALHAPAVGIGAMPTASLAANARNLILARRIREQVTIRRVGTVANGLDGVEFIDIAVASTRGLVALDVVLVGAPGAAVVSDALAVGNAGHAAAHSSFF